MGIEGTRSSLSRPKIKRDIVAKLSFFGRFFTFDAKRLSQTSLNVDAFDFVERVAVSIHWQPQTAEPFLRDVSGISPFVSSYF